MSYGSGARPVRPPRRMSPSEPKNEVRGRRLEVDRIGFLDSKRSNSSANVSCWRRRMRSRFSPSSLRKSGSCSGLSKTAIQSKGGLLTIWYARTARVSSATAIYGKSVGHFSSTVCRKAGPPNQHGVIASLSKIERVAASAGFSLPGTKRHS